MTVLEQITQMKSQGIPEAQITGSLREQGVSPKQITDALAQSQIKSAVAGETPIPTADGMQPSIMGGETPPISGEQAYTPQTQEVAGGQMPTQDAYAQQPAQAGEYYEGGYDYNSQPAGGTDTMIEIAAQVFSEKIKKLQKQITGVAEFKTIAETKLENIEDRLKRIENSFDKLQIEILNKVGSYGNTLQSIKKEMSMMQDSFGKTMKKISTPTKKKTSKKK
ncbi:hypothetical protein HN832_00675 [archaeon]|jgi:hypothetical protein|nr:hypothetical protein [archaeon]MBT4373864.1 hypothetical protein [archaeon]MBT4532386.1 hypothetical protein [archaeon]MBT7001767.1 hypothetical protein [archaeon]MBT7281908.1 hypothetical protein [archaeon]